MTNFKNENLVASIIIILCLSGIACGQDELPQPPRTTPISKILQIDEVQQELELSPEQIEMVMKIGRDVMSEISQLRNRALEGKTPDSIFDVEESKASGEVLRSMIDDSERAISEEVLLDFQEKRLKQIQWRIEMNRLGIDRFLEVDSVSAFLGMTEEEKKDFAKKVLQEKIRVAKEMEKLRFEMERNVVSMIPKTCQENFDKLLGEEFQINRSSWQQQPKR